MNNRRVPMVLHLVHLKDGCQLGDPGCAVVISVLIEKGTPQDSTSALLQTLFNNFRHQPVIDLPRSACKG